MLEEDNQIDNQNFDRNIPVRRFSWRDLVIVVAAGLIGFLGGLASWFWLVPADFETDGRPLVIEREPEIIREEKFHYLPQTSHEERIIQATEQVLPGVVNISVTREVAVDPFLRDFNWFFELEPQSRQEVGHGTGFFVSSDGLILTNKHVVLETGAEYRVTTADRESYSAEVLARDPLNDLALLKIEGDDFPVMELGDSDKLVPGQTVLAIGNALGQFEGTVSTGIISGLSRAITAYGRGYTDTMTGLIQTDAAINHGNSGGPLLDLNGRVVGVNVAMAEQAQNVGFAIPINQAERAIRSVKETGRIVYPFLGISYVMVDEEIKKERDLPYDYGALIVRDRQSGRAIVPGSAAESMGLQEGDLILEFNEQRVDRENMLNRIILRHDPGDNISLRVWRKGGMLTLSGQLGEKES